MQEFELIAQYLAPLAGEGAFGLTDDAALHHGMVMSTDVLIDQVHFRTDDGWKFAAKKALRVNVSDIIAKGATPEGVFLGIVWPVDVKEAEIAEFCEGLAADIKAYGLSLLGGDTNRHRYAGAPLTISVTMTGRPGPRGPVLRSGAKPGDLVFVTGNIGDGWLGLHTQLTYPAEFPHAVDYYLCPEPPVALAEVIGLHASSAIDISDGLVADAGHVAKASGVEMEFQAEDIPLSEEARKWYGMDGEIAPLLTGGDDYQVLLSVPEAGVPGFREAAAAVGISVTQVGKVMAGSPDVRVLTVDGTPMSFRSYGYTHF